MTQKKTSTFRTNKKERKRKPLEKRQLRFETLEEKAAPSGSLLGMAAMAAAASYSYSSHGNSEAEYSSYATQNQSVFDLRIDLSLQFDPEWDVLESRALDRIFSDWDTLGEGEQGGSSSGATTITDASVNFSNANTVLGEDDFTPLAEASLRAAMTNIVTKSEGTTASVFSATEFMNQLETGGVVPGERDLEITPREHGNIYSAVIAPLQNEVESENVIIMQTTQSGGSGGENSGGQVDLPVASIQVISENSSILESEGYLSGGSTNAGSGGEDEGTYLEFAITLTSEDYHNGSDVRFRVETGEVMVSSSDYRLEDGNGAPLQNYDHNGFYAFPISGGTSAIFRMVPENDSKLEGDEKVVITLIPYEELPPDPFSGGHYAYKVEGNDSITMTILDDEQLVLEKVVFDGQLDMIADPGTSYWDTSLHWKRGDLSKTVPVAYANSAASTNYLKAEGFFSIVSDSGQPGTLDLGVSDDVEIRFKAEGLSATSDWQSAYYSVGDQILRSTILSSEKTIRNIYGTQQADYIAALELHWQFRVNEGEIKDATGHSVNPFYVTFDAPLGGTLYHTVVHTGCVAADGETTQQAVFDAVWGKFSGASIDIFSVYMEDGQVVDGDEDYALYYYGKVLNENNPASIYPNPTNKITVARKNQVDTTYGLLLLKDGKCSSWADFFIDVSGVQGILVEQVTATPTVYQGTVPLENGQTTQANIHDNIRMPADSGKHHGASPKERIFGEHIIVKYGGSYYDTSYGFAYGSNTDEGAQENMAKRINAYGYVVALASIANPPQASIGYTNYMVVQPNNYGQNATADWMAFDK